MAEPSGPPRTGEAGAPLCTRFGRADVLAGTVIVAIWCAFWWPVLAGDIELYARDLTFFATPMKQYWAARVGAFELPVWTPLVSGGMPFLADVSNQALYPLNAIFLLVAEPLRAVSLFVIVHQLLGMLSFQVLARALGARAWLAAWTGAAYGLSGYVVSITDNVNFVPSVAWVPAALGAFLLGLQRRSHRWTALAGLALAMLVFAGSMLDAMVLAGVLGLLTLLHGARSPFAWRHLVGAGVIGALVAAVQILPTLAHIPLSIRADGLPYAEIVKFSFPLPRVFDLVHPFLLGSTYPAFDFKLPSLYPQMGEPWVNSVYHGVVPLALAAVALGTGRRALPWSLLAGGAFALALGDNAPWFRAVIEHVPPLASQRYPEKYLFWFSVGTWALAGLGAERLMAANGPVGAWLATRSTIVRAGLGAAVVLIVFALLDRPLAAWVGDARLAASAYWSGRLPGTQSHGAGLLVHAGMVAAALVGLLWSGARAGCALAGVLSLALLDLFWLHYLHVPTAPRGLIAGPEPRVVEVIRAAAPGWVYYDERAPGQTVHYVAGPLVERIVAATGERPGNPASQHMSHYVSAHQRERLKPNTNVVYSIPFLNGDFSPLQPATHARFEQALGGPDSVARLRSVGVSHVLTALDPARREWQQGDAHETWRSVADNLRLLAIDRPRPAAWLSAPHPPAPETGTGVVEVLERRPERWRVRVAAGARARLLVLATSYAPGWRASLDGQDAPVREANDRLLAVAVPAGEHEVVVEYHAPGLRLGALLSALGVCCALAGLAAPGMGARSGRHRTGPLPTTRAPGVDRPPADQR